MRKSRYLIVNVSMATLGAGIGGIAPRDTRRSRDSGLIDVLAAHGHTVGTVDRCRAQPAILILDLNSLPLGYGTRIIYVGQVTAIVECPPSDVGHTLGNRDGCKTTTAVKYSHIQRGNTLGNHDGGQAGATHEGTLTDRHHVLGNRNSGQAPTRDKGSFAYGYHAVRNLDHDQTGTIGKGIIADGGHTVTNYHGDQADAGIESVATDGGHTSGDLHFSQACAILKCRATDRGHAIHDGHRGQTGTAKECLLVNNGYASGNHDLGQGKAIGKGFLTNVCHTLGDFYKGQIIAVGKNIVLNGGNPLGNLDGGQANTHIERSVVNRGHACGNPDLSQTDTSIKSMPTDKGHTIVNDDRRHFIAILECMVADGCYLLGDHKLGQISPVEGRIANCGHVRRNLTVLEAQDEGISCRFNYAITRGMVNRVPFLHNDGLRQTEAESIGLNSSHTLRDLDIGQTDTMEESILIDVGHAVGDRDRGKIEVASKGLVTDRSDRVTVNAQRNHNVQIRTGSQIGDRTGDSVLIHLVGKAVGAIGRNGGIGIAIPAHRAGMGSIAGLRRRGIGNGRLVTVSGRASLRSPTDPTGLRHKTGGFLPGMRSILAVGRTARCTGCLLLTGSITALVGGFVLFCSAHALRPVMGGVGFYFIIIMGVSKSRGDNKAANRAYLVGSFGRLIAADVGHRNICLTTALALAYVPVTVGVALPLVGIVGMTQRKGQNLTAYSTGLIALTGSGRTGSVAKLPYQGHAAVGADLIILAIGGRAGIMAALRGQDLTASGTGLIVLAVSLGAGNVTPLGGQDLTAQSTGLIVYTVGTVIGGMAKCIGIVSGVGKPAHRAGVCGVAAGGTGGRSYLRSICVTRRRNHVVGIAVAARGAGIDGVTALITSGRSYNGIIAVADSRNLVVNVGTTASTGIDGVTGLDAGGSYDGGFVAMSQLFCQHGAARGTDLVVLTFRRVAGDMTKCRTLGLPACGTGLGSGAGGL